MAESYIVNQTHFKCKNGEVVELYVEPRYKIRALCTGSPDAPDVLRSICSDNSEITIETCAWACNYNEILPTDWACPGEPKCIGRDQICDGNTDCANGQDEDTELCTESFCRDGFISVETFHSDERDNIYDYDLLPTPREYRNRTISKHYLFSANTYKCVNSTKCNRRRYINGEYETC